MSPETISGQVSEDERYGAMGGGYRRGMESSGDEQHNGMRYDPAVEKPRLPSLDLDGPTEPDFTATGGWLDESAGSLADHPLLRGLLLELPPKGSTPPPGWMDRWFEATRAILELLYVTDHGRR